MVFWLRRRYNLFLLLFCNVATDRGCSFLVRSFRKNPFLIRCIWRRKITDKVNSKEHAAASPWSTAAATADAEKSFFSLDDDDDDNKTNEETNKPLTLEISSEKRVRPHDQRANAPRPARRLNHVFKYLYRHDIPTHIQSMDPLTYLQEHVGYTYEQVVAMNQTFPPLLTLSVPRQLHPKVRFLEETLQIYETRRGGGSSNESNSSTDKAALSLLPPQYFGARLERVLAPRHAFLVYTNLTHGSDLVHNPSKWDHFLQAVRKPKAFAALCQSWQSSSTSDNDILSSNRATSTTSKKAFSSSITVKQIEAFDVLFGRGLMAAARNELVQPHNTWPMRYLNVTAAQMLDLLIQHGANPWQYDHRGVSLLHWAAGTGHLEAIPILLRSPGPSSSFSFSANPQHPVNTIKTETITTARPPLHVFHTRTLRDGATALHWAAAGAKARAFGCGGHVDVCRYLLDQLPTTQQRKEYVNVLTKDGNSALMWAAWSGTLETVKLLVRQRADSNHKNRNGCTVAHWAASGGNLAVCQYLHDIVGVDFSLPNHGGNTPLTHAVAFGRTEVVAWLRDHVLLQKHNNNNYTDDDIAYDLAMDFVHWTNGDDDRRLNILQLFENDGDWESWESKTQHDDQTIHDEEFDDDF
ncbi:hypothetical protein ACA910_000217 [Epithemia clementina (nom. ined.)]